MKRLISMFFWFCAATVIAQGCIVGLSYFRGNLSRKSFVQIVALLNGIDIPGQRLKNAIAAGYDVPVPTREEILTSKIESSLEFDSREKALKRWQAQLQTEQEKQEKEAALLAQHVKEHKALVAQFNSGLQDQTLKDVQSVLELIAPEQAKLQLLSMINEGAMSDVVAIIKGMAEDKRKKILAEFTTGEESTKLGDILKELRVVEPKAVSTPKGDSVRKASE